MVSLIDKNLSFFLSFGSFDSSDYIVNILKLTPITNLKTSSLSQEKVKVENISEDSLDSIPSPSLQWKFQSLAGKFNCWVVSTNILFSKAFWQCPLIFCLNTSSKFTAINFNFSLKVKVMGSIFWSGGCEVNFSHILTELCSARYYIICKAILCTDWNIWLYN